MVSGRGITEFYINLWEKVKNPGCVHTVEFVYAGLRFGVNGKYFENDDIATRGGRVLPEKLGMGVRPASQKPYPIYDQNLRFSLPYLSPDQKFDTLFI